MAMPHPTHGRTEQHGRGAGSQHVTILPNQPETGLNTTETDLQAAIRESLADGKRRTIRQEMWLRVNGVLHHWTDGHVL